MSKTPTKIEDLKLQRLQIENFKGIKFAEIFFKPGDHLVEITGRNGQGKTSAIEALDFLMNGITAVGKEPVRVGAAAAKVIGENSRFVICRELSAEGKLKLRVMPKDGSAAKNTQEFIDETFGPDSFKAAAFAEMNEKQRNVCLQKILNLGFDLDAENTRHKMLYDQRRDANRDADQFEKILVTFEGLPRTAPNMIDGASLEADLKRLQEEDECHRRVIESAGTDNARYEALSKSIEDRAITIARMEAKLAETKAEQSKECQERIDAHHSLTLNETLAANSTPADYTEYHAKVATMTETNDIARRCKERDSVIEQAREKAAESDALTDQMNAIKDKIDAALAAAPFPVEGLIYNGIDTRYNGVLYDQCSESEKLYVSACIGLATRGNLRMMRMPGGEIDQETKARMFHDALAQDCIIIMDSCDTSGEIGLVIEAGEVVKVNPQFHPEEVAA